MAVFLELCYKKVICTWENWSEGFHTQWDFVRNLIVKTLGKVKKKVNGNQKETKNQMITKMPDLCFIAIQIVLDVP